ncbi:MAG: extracellular solute-binding protein [Clostridia bacterium]|nr:extracellular solute-binding protein [Clostridia bacterium]
MTRKFFALMLALVLALSLGTTAFAEADVPYIVFYNNSGAFSVSAGTEAEMYKAMQDYIIEQVGVKVDIIQPPSGDEAQKLSVLLASGDQLDAWWGNWKEYAADGIITNLDAYKDNEDLKKLIDIWSPWYGSVEGLTDDQGVLWAIPRNNSTAAYPVFFRNDYLEALDMEIPSTIEELEEYIYAVKEADFYGNGGTIALATSSLSDLEMTFLGGYVETGKGFWLADNGDVMPYYLAEGYEDFLAKMNQWYNDGIFHSECFSWDATTLRQYIASGAVAATAHWYSRVTLENANLEANMPDFDYDKYTYVYTINENGIVGDNGVKIQTQNGTRSPQGLLISSKCQNVEALLKFVAWSYDSYNYNTTCIGFENEHWIYDPADPAAVENNKIKKDLEGARVYARDFCVSLGLPTEILTSEFYEDGRQDMHNLWLQEKLALTEEMCIMPGETWACTFDTEALSLNAPSNGDVNTYYAENCLKFVTGERDLAEFDQFVEELYAAGLQEVIDEYTRQWELYLDTAA